MFAYCEEQSTKVGKQLELLFRLKFDEFEKETRSACSHPTGEKSRTGVVTARSAACSARPHAVDIPPYSQENAVGLIMGVGNVGRFLSSRQD